jgi:uncharacterized hydrophobic protein (TIGR00271 family)
MAIISHFRTVGEADKNRAIETLIADSTPDFNFFFLVTLSVLMASFGMLADSVAIVIGSMLIAPILYPILSLSLGVSMSDYKLISRSFYTLVKSVVIGIIAGIVATLFFSNGDGVTSEILARTEPSLVYFLVAIISGVAVSYALVKPNLSETLPGVAVSVALIPPLSVMGIGIAKLDWAIVSGSTVLFLINVAGIVFASMVSFSLMNVVRKQKVAEVALKKEDARVLRENEKIEKIEEAEREAVEKEN